MCDGHEFGQGAEAECYGMNAPFSRRIYMLKSNMMAAEGVAFRK
jgi:hypothetical protein